MAPRQENVPLQFKLMLFQARINLKVELNIFSKRKLRCSLDPFFFPSPRRKSFEVQERTEQGTVPGCATSSSIWGSAALSNSSYVPSSQICLQMQVSFFHE